MGVKMKENYIYKTESAWSDGNNPLLCLNTGTWRTQRPVINVEICNGCGICATFCPPQCIKCSDTYVVDLEYCKGCGICAKECPKKAITMMAEGEYADDCTIK